MSKPATQKKLTYNQAYKLALKHLNLIKKGNLEAFCLEHKINYGSIKNFKSDKARNYPKLLLELLTIFNYDTKLVTEYVFVLKPSLPKLSALKPTFKTIPHERKKTRSAKGGNRPPKK